MLSCGILIGETSRTRLAPSGEESDTLTGLTGQSRSTTETPWIGIALTRWPDAFACTEERRVPAASRIAWKPFDVRVVENWHCSTEALGAGTRAHQIYGGGVSGILNRVGPPRLSLTAGGVQANAPGTGRIVACCRVTSADHVLPTVTEHSEESATRPLPVDRLVIPNKKGQRYSCSYQRNAFNVRLQSPPRRIATRQGWRQACIHRVQSFWHPWLRCDRRTERGGVPSSRHRGRI